MKTKKNTRLLQPHEKKRLPLVGLFTREEREESMPTEGISILHQTNRYPAPITHKPHDNVSFS